MDKLVIFFLIFFILGFLFFSFRITDVPPGINGDEAAIGYNAALVARTGHDSSGRFFPLFVSAFDLTDWKQPITFYSTALAFKIFGPSYTLLRQVSVVFVLISTMLIFLLAKETLDLKAAFLSMFIFITIPAVLIQSHLALENIAPVPFTVFWLLMLAKYQKTLEQKYLYLTGFFLGIDWFTYPGMRIIFPVFFLLSLGFIFYLNRTKKFMAVVSLWIRFALIALFFPLLMWLVKNQYPGAILAYNRPHTISSYQDFFTSYISSFDPSFLFITGDITPYHSTGKQGVFLLATLPLFILGIIKIIRKKDLMLNFIVLTFFLTPALYGLVGTIHRGSRLLALLPSYALIATVGVLSLTAVKNKIGKFILISIVFLLILLNYADFLRDYFWQYPQRVKSDFAKPYQLVFEKAAIMAKSTHLSLYIQSDFRSQNQIAVDFFAQTLSDKIENWKEDQAIPPSSIIIVSDYILSKKKETPQVNIGEGFGLLINQTKNEIR